MLPSPVHSNNIHFFLERQPERQVCVFGWQVSTRVLRKGQCIPLASGIVRCHRDGCFGTVLLPARLLEYPEDMRGPFYVYLLMVPHEHHRPGV